MKSCKEIRAVLCVVTLLSLSSQGFGHDLVRDVVGNANEILKGEFVPAMEKCKLGADGKCLAEQFATVQGGFHGQLFFGTGPFYLSHLPLFSPPHNYQAIYEVEFVSDSEAQMVKEKFLKKVVGERYGTFAPGRNPKNPQQDSSNFKIPEFTCHARVDKEKVMYGKVYSGHFERSEQSPEQLGSAGLRIKRVIFYKELNANDPEGEQEADPKADGDYIVFGEKGKYFASRVIGKRPAVDHIFPITEKNAIEFMDQQIGANDYLKFQTKQKNNDRQFSLNGKTVDVPIQNFYLETGELR